MSRPAKPNRPLRPAEDLLMRQQYLVPRRSVTKLHRISKQQGVSATEVVRRAIDAYEPGDAALTPQEESVALELLDGIHARLRTTLARLDEESIEWHRRMAALAEGRMRDKVRRETEAFLRKQPHLLEGLERLFAPGAHKS